MIDRRNMPEPDQAQIDEWLAQYGKGHVIRLEQAVEGEEGANLPSLVIFARKPNPQHVGRFSMTAQRDPYKAMKDLVLDCRLWPDAETVKARFEELPGLVIGLAGELNSIMGTNISFTLKRF